MREYTDEELRRVQPVLSDAKTFRRADESDWERRSDRRSTYHACFHGAQAALYAAGYDPESHRAVVRLFGREFVRDGVVAPGRGRFLHTMHDRRNDADYGYDVLRVAVDKLVASAEEFLCVMRAVLVDTTD